MSGIKFELIVNAELDRQLKGTDVYESELYDVLTAIPRDCLEECAYSMPDDVPVLDLLLLEKFLYTLENTVNKLLRESDLNTRALVLCFHLPQSSPPVLSFFLFPFISEQMISETRVICPFSNQTVYH